MIAVETGMQDLKRMALRGGLAKLFGQVGNLSLRFGFMIVVARLLQPEDFGLMAMVTVVTGVLELFSSAGLSMATVQRSTINNEQISTLFWINILVGMALGAVATAVVLPFVPIGRWFGFVAPPPLFFVYLIVATAAYLALVEISKVFFYRWTVGS